MEDFMIAEMEVRKHDMRQAFQELDGSKPIRCDRFFEAYGPGNSTTMIDRPLERFHDYEMLLILIANDDREKYEEMHKGTPFYFLGWLAFELRNYEAANFYMSAALAEDRRKSGSSFDVWIQNPAGQFMLLNQGNQSSYITKVMFAFVQNAIMLFASKNPSTQYRVEDFINNFSRRFIQKGSYSIVTALYGFIMEHEERYKNLKLTSANIEATEPLLLNLFKGGLIFETLLKNYYPTDDQKKPIRTLTGFHFSADFRTHFPGCDLGQQCDSLQEIVDDAASFDYKTTFENTAKLRNTTGHELLWDNVFSNPENYRKLYEQEILAIFYLLAMQASTEKVFTS